MNIRLAVQDDLETFLRHAVEFREADKAMGDSDYLDDDHEFIREYARFLCLIFERGDYYMYVAEADGKVIGTLIGCVSQTESFVKADLFGDIRFIYIDMENREKNVAKLLVEQFEDAMRDIGIKTVVAMINQWNSMPQFKLLHHGWHYKYVQLNRRL